MPGRAFVDTNVFVYLNSDTDSEKMRVAESVLNSYDCVVSTQVTNELCNVLIKKFGKSADEIKSVISAMEMVCDIAILTVGTTNKALDIQDRYGYSFYDSLIVSAALESDCKYIISEDLQGGQIVDGKLAIVNPFAV
ncbi:MAG: PIN domain-containing protein [Clostridiales bacterium]|nr:PIN domain-containing protein [Clostridiales bacterium]